MELKRLRYFRCVVEAGGITRAAKTLALTPGTLSKAMRQLELDLDVELFVRLGRTLQLTDAGRALYRASEGVIDEYARMLTQVTQRALPPGDVLRLASFEAFTTHTLGPIVAEHFADVALRLLELSLPRICEAVALREADFGVTYVPYPRPEIDFRKLVRFEFGVFVRRGAFSHRAVTDIPFAAPISTIQSSATELLAVDSWPADKVPRRIVYRLTSLESALELVRRGLCAVFIPIFLAGLHNQTVKPSCRLERLENPPRMRPVHQTAHLVVRIDEQRPLVKRVAAAIRATVEQGLRAIENSD